MLHTKTYNCVYNIILVGDTGVGKSSLIEQFVDFTFYRMICFLKFLCSSSLVFCLVSKDSHIPTFGIESKAKVVQLESEKVKLQLWDTAGQERFRAITTNYYRNAGGAIIVYDLTCPESFANVTAWFEEIQKHASPDIEIILVGSKSDASSRCISLQDQDNLAKSLDLPFFETSAKTNDNVEAAFVALASRIKETAQRRQYSNIKLPQTNCVNHGRKCCKI